MSASSRNVLLTVGAVWGFVMAAIPSLAAFDDPFTISPFLIAAHLCAAASGAFGFWMAGRGTSGLDRSARGDTVRGALRVVGAGASQALVAATLAAFSIWLMMAINMSGFSEDSPGGLLNIFREPSIWVESLIVAQAVFAYAVVVGLLLSPISGTAIRLLARP